MAKRALAPRQIPLEHRYHSAARDPWTLDATKLPNDDDLNIQSKVILVLGEPQLDVILPLLYSPHLVSSLVVIVTARSYNIPTNISPSVAILRLGKPLSTSESAAPRLVNVLQWADRVASAWRNHPAPPQIQELSEDAPAAGYLTPPSQRHHWFSTSSSSSSPSSFDPDFGLSRTSSRLSRYSFTRSASSTSLSTLAKSVKPSKPAERHAFDSLFNFLPPDAPDQHLLKHVILVTTLSRPFLTCTLPSPSESEKKERRRFTLRTRAASESDIPTTPRLSPAHIVHLVPLSRTTLIRPLESFCLTFAHSAVRSDDHAPARIDIGIPGPTPRPFILPPIALGEVLPISRKWTVAELILCGALDGDHARSGSGGTGSLSRRPSTAPNLTSPSVRDPSKTLRAWMSGAGDILVTGAGRGFQKSAYVPSGLRNRNDWSVSAGTGKRARAGAGQERPDAPYSENALRASQCSTGLVTPPESDTSESGEAVKRRKGILRWFKR
ncbi:hypothetical protein BU17DRAFT_101650 [Hysterangium stoloniferum]|nr:hypothetical protein BU17DRAFT_101650 [Hysterangium stoloniferum]